MTSSVQWLWQCKTRFVCSHLPTVLLSPPPSPCQHHSYGKRAAALDPSRIDIASLHPTGEYAISSLSGITNNLVITVAIPLGLAGTPGSAAAAAAQGTIATTATAVGAGARSPSGATGGGGAGGGAGAVGTAGAGAGSAAAANGGSGGGTGASAAAGGGSPAAARPDFVPHMGYHDPADAAAPKPSSVQRVDDDPSSPVDGFFNFVMAGESGVGKSSLLLNFSTPPHPQPQPRPRPHSLDC